MSKEKITIELLPEEYSLLLKTLQKAAWYEHSTAVKDKNIDILLSTILAAV